MINKIDWCNPSILPLPLTEYCSDSEILLHVINVINKAIDQIITNEKDIDEIKEWIKTLNLTDEVKKQLLEMLEDGRLATLINDIVAPYENIRSYGAIGDGIADDTNAFQKAYESNKIIFVSSGTYKCTKSIEPKNNIETKFIVDKNAIFTDQTPIEFYRAINASTDYVTGSKPNGNALNTKTAIYANMDAGVRGKVLSNTYTQSLVRSSTKSFVWDVVSVVSIAENIVNDAENVSMYAQINGNKTSDTGMWAGCFELNDPYANPKASKTGVEITYRSAEQDGNKARHPLHVALSASPNASGGQVDSIILVTGNNENNAIPKVGANTLIRLEGVDYLSLLDGSRSKTINVPRVGIGFDFTNINVVYSVLKAANFPIQFSSLSLKENTNKELELNGGAHQLKINGEVEAVSNAVKNVSYLKIFIDGNPYYIPLYTKPQ